MTQARDDLDRFRARVQARLFGGLAGHARRLAWTEAEIRRHQRDRLRALLAHAIARSPFHGRRLAWVEPGGFELADLRRLPVMTKAEMMDGLDDVFTDRRLSRARVEDVLARTTDAPIPMLDAYVAQASGGSSGRRGLFVADEQAQAEFASAILRPTVARGGLPPSGLTAAFVAASSAVHATGIPPKMLEGGPIRFVSAPAALPIRELVERLNRIAPDGLFGYPSALARLAAERRAGRLTIAPSLVRSTGETLLPETRASIRAAFEAPIVDTFASSEGLVGVSDPDDEVLVFASDQAIVELVDERDRPVAPGEPSSRALVTMLESRAQPLIRYALDDLFVEQPASPPGGHLRALVRGRSDECLRYDGVEIHPIAVRSALVKTREALDYQVRQTRRGIDVDVVAEAGFDADGLRHRLAEALAGAGLAAALVNVRAVPALAPSTGVGKLRRIVPLT